MADTLLNKISKHPNNTIVTDAWLTGQTGEIVDLQGNCVFRFIDYIDSPELRIKHTTEESQLSCPVVACGLVGYWLHKKDAEGIKAIFEGYYELRLKEYEKAHESDDDAWERDFKKEFVCRYHLPKEKKLIKASEALFAYITESDQKKIKSITDNYLKFARTKHKEFYPPNHPANRMIEDTFLDAYRMGDLHTNVCHGCVQSITCHTWDHIGIKVAKRKKSNFLANGRNITKGLYLSMLLKDTRILTIVF